MTYYVNDYITQQRKKAYTYNVTTAAATTPVSLAEVKAFLKLDASDASEDAFLTMLIEAATEAAEKYIGRDLINKGYTTFRDNLVEPLELRRSKVSAITSIEYLVSDVFTLIASTVYGFTDVNDYAQIFLEEDQSWPTDIDNLPQAVRILFTSGYGTAGSDVPAAIKIGLLQHVNVMYSNRGDCGGGCTNDIGALPSSIKSLYTPFRIINIGSYQRPFTYCGE